MLRTFPRKRANSKYYFASFYLHRWIGKTLQTGLQNPSSTKRAMHPPTLTEVLFMPKNSLLLSVIALTTISVNASGEMIYKCRNQQGEMKYQKSACAENIQTTSSLVEIKTTKPAIKQKKTLVIDKGVNGHYFLEGEVNSTALTFVVDTGASVVSLPSSVARAAEIDCKKQVTMNTANGLANACTIVIPKLKIGSFIIEEVAAVVVPNLSEPLLGMNVLQQFNIVQDHGQMRISER
jgi:clan AA aspartic protease (TIGR02281 family)